LLKIQVGGLSYLVCTSLADGCEVASNLRECRCGTQLWVSAAMTLLVDSAELTPICWPCHHQTGRPVTIHPREIKELDRMGRLEDGWRVIGEMNSPQAEEYA
jgi:hypothetical protein